ncbi:hypothetical protein HGO75_19415, partial [Mycobacterium tuberculosis]|nr:hypothetical protein [Mycobacterium tuberculosis]
VAKAAGTSAGAAQSAIAELIAHLPNTLLGLTSPGPASSPLMLFAPSVQLDHEPSVCVLASRLIVLVHLKLP